MLDRPGRRRRTRARDLNELAASIVAEATRDERSDPAADESPAVQNGRLGGLKGGKARAEKLSAERRREIAQKAAQARWGSRSN
jgi:hypothetical protein